MGITNRLDNCCELPRFAYRLNTLFLYFVYYSYLSYIRIGSFAWFKLTHPVKGKHAVRVVADNASASVPHRFAKLVSMRLGNIDDYFISLFHINIYGNISRSISSPSALRSATASGWSLP